MLREFVTKGLSGDWALPGELNATNVIGTTIGGRSFPVSKKTLRNEIAVEEFRMNYPTDTRSDQEIIDTFISTEMFRDDPERFPRSMKAQEQLDSWQRETGSKWQQLGDEKESYNANQFQKQVEDGAKDIKWGISGGGEDFRDVLDDAYSGQASYTDERMLQLGINPDDLPQSQGKDIDLYRQYKNLRLDDFVLPDGKPDFDGFKTAQQGLLTQMSAPMKDLIQSGKDTRVTTKRGNEANTRLTRAKSDLSRWFDAPKYKGLTKDEGAKVDQLLEWAAQLDDMATLAGVSIDRRDILAMMGSIPQYSKFAAVAFFTTFPFYKKMVLSDEKMQITLGNGDLAVFYPYTYEDLADDMKVKWAELYARR